MTIEEYSELLCLELPKLDKIFHKEPKKFGFWKKQAQITGISVETIDQKTKRKGESDCILWHFFWDYIREYVIEDRDLDVFTLGIYDIVIFSRVKEHVEAVVVVFLSRYIGKPTLFQLL